MINTEITGEGLLTVCASKAAARVSTGEVCARWRFRIRVDHASGDVMAGLEPATSASDGLPYAPRKVRLACGALSLRAATHLESSRSFGLNRLMQKLV